MIAHYYECERCFRGVPIVWLGYGSGAGDEFRDRLPDGWAVVYHKSESRSYCPECWKVITHGD